jgi:hypothetical protein
MPAHKRDLLTIRAASTLLAELWDGKLRQTLKLFSRKISSEVKLKHFLESKLTAKHLARWLEGVLQVRGLAQSALFQSPPWMLWRNRELFKRMIERQEGSLSLLHAILSCEQQSRFELAELAAVQVFPAQEVAFIRKDLRALRERQEASLPDGKAGTGVRDKPQSSKRSVSTSAGTGTGTGTGASNASALSIDLLSEDYDQLLELLREELQLCDRKRSLLRDRRECEEEQRAQQAKRQLRLKAMEDAQARDRDPVNFRNQAGRFS